MTESADNSGPAAEQESAAEIGRWLDRPRCEGEIDLYCFPPAGNGAATFRKLPLALQPEIAVYRIQPPGRETRFDEPFCRSWSDYCARITAAVQSQLSDRPFAFLGHSMGSLVAFECARALAAATGRNPCHFFASAFRDPAASPAAPIGGLPDREFIESLRERYGGIEDEVLQHPELLQVILPILRADLAILEQYRPARDYRLDCPVTALGGIADHWAGAEEISGWGHFTTAEFALHQLDGGHFFIRDAGDDLMRIIRRALVGG